MPNLVLLACYHKNVWWPVTVVPQVTFLTQRADVELDVHTSTFTFARRVLRADVEFYFRIHQMSLVWQSDSSISLQPFNVKPS